MNPVPGSLDPRAWRSFFRSTLWSWRDCPQLRAMDHGAFERYQSESRFVQDALAALSSTPRLDQAFLAQIAPALERLLQRMNQFGDDITAFILFKQAGSLLEDHGLDEAVARALQWAGRCGRDLRYYDESQMLLDRALACALRVDPHHPHLIEIYSSIGLLCHFTRRWDEAESNYRKSLALLELWPQAEVLRQCRLPKSRILGNRLTNLLDLHLVRAQLSPPGGRGPELMAAKSLLERVRGLSADDPIALEFATADDGEILLLEGRVGEAGALLTAHLAHLALGSPAAPRLIPAVHRLLAMVCAEEGRIRDAYDHCREALEESLHRPSVYWEGVVVDTTLDILSRSIRPRITGTGLDALNADDRQILNNLVLMLERKDWYTGNNHSRAVSRMSRMLGERLLGDSPSQYGRPGDSPDYLDLQLLELGGLLHDIGKLRIPWSLLNKSNPLTPIEHRILESHVSEGGAMLRQLGFVSLARLVEEHHEKLDGSGYPLGRKRLSLMGAVVAVTDAYEAMVTPNRRYTAPRSRQSAIKELEDCSGRFYHPRVVQALEDIVAGQPP